MTTTHAEIRHAAGHLPDQRSNTRSRQAQDVLDSPAPLPPSHHVFHDEAVTGDAGMEERVPSPPLLAVRLFGGCCVSPPSGASPCQPVSLARGAGGGYALWASSAAFLSCVRPALGGLRETTVLVVSWTNSRGLAVGVGFLPRSGACGHRASVGRGRRRSGPSSAVAGAPSKASGRVARRRAARSGAGPKAAQACCSTGRHGCIPSLAGGGRMSPGNACIGCRGCVF